MAELDPSTVADIRTHARKLLVRADALEVFPTPVERIVEVAGLVQSGEWVLDESKIRKAAPELRRMLRGARRKVRGTLDRTERVIYVDSTLDRNRQRFVSLHETSHDILPWQTGMTVFGDDDVTLAPRIQSQFEQEANQGAAELLFQGDLFDRIARDHPTTLSTPIELAVTMGASIHATIRRWVEGHERALCVLVLKASPAKVDPLQYKVMYPIESRRWREMFGQGSLGRTVSATTMPFLHTLVDPWGVEIDDTWPRQSLDGQVRSLRVESFANSYNVFVLFRVPARDRLIARHRGAATILQA